MVQIIAFLVFTEAIMGKPQPDGPGNSIPLESCSSWLSIIWSLPWIAFDCISNCYCAIFNYLWLIWLLKVLAMLNHIFLLFALHISLIHATRVSLTDSPAYQSARPCMYNCFGNRDTNWLANNIDCDNTNECICRLDLQPSIVSQLKLCIDGNCRQNEVDRSYGVSLYTSYCTAAGYTVTLAAVTSSEGTCSPTVTITITSIQTIFATSAAKRGIMIPLQNFFAARFWESGLTKDMSAQLQLLHVLHLPHAQLFRQALRFQTRQ